MSAAPRSLDVLAISPFMPYPPDHGGRIRTFLLLRELARRGHGVRLIALAESAADAQRAAALTAEGIATTAVLHPRRFGRLTAADRLRKLANLVRGRSDVLARFDSPAALKAAREGSTRPPDVVLAELLWTAPIALALPGAAHVLDAHNLETLISRRTAAATTGALARAAARREAVGMARDEARLARRFDAVIAVSAADAAAFRALVPEVSCEVIGNCVDTDALSLLPAPAAGPPLCLFVGSANYPPNAQAIERFARRIFPQVVAHLPGARFVAVGADPPAHLQRLAAETPGMQMAGYLADVVDAYRVATQVVVPLAVGGGTRTKILEAFALGRPVVSTAVGAEGLGAAADHELLLADEDDALAAAIVGLHRDPDRAAHLIHSGRRFVEANGSARAAGTRLEQVLATTCERRAAR